MIAMKSDAGITPVRVIQTITPVAQRGPVGGAGYCRSVPETGRRLATTADGDHPPLSRALLGRPHSTGELLGRPRLVERFDAALRCPLTIVSGEPAAGKTSMVLDWLRSEAGHDRPIGWLTVDASLNDPGLFWRYMLAVVERLGVETDDLGRALDDEPSPGRTWLTTFTNRLAEIPGDPVLVIDDFHLIERRETLIPAHDLIERLTESEHVVLLTRSKPPWRLDRWRANGVLCEIESDELRFTLDEASALIKSTSQHELAPGDVELLARRTEGWAGGLRLALLSLAHTADPAAFIATFAGDDELVASYLFREVLDSQPAEIRDFLLEVSVFDDFYPDLCDEVRAADDSDELLGRCRLANLFVVDLDATGRHCRLHALFAQLLRARLAAQDPARLAALHSRASRAAETRGDVRAAVGHAADSADADRTGELIAQYASRLAHLGQFDTIDQWISLLPPGPRGLSPETSLGLASSLCLASHPDEAHRVLDRLFDQDEPDRVEYAATQLRAMINMFVGRVDRLAALAAQLDREVPVGDLTLPFEPRRLVAYLQSISAYYGDDLPAARAASQLATDITERPSLFYIEGPGVLARVCVAEGHLSEALRHADESLRRADELGSADTAVRLKANLAMGDVAWERNDLDAAEVHLATALRSVRPLLWQAVIVQLSSSRLLASSGAIDRARDELVDAARTYWTGEEPPALRAQLCRNAIDLALRAGDIGDALRWEHTLRSIDGVEVGNAIELRLARARGDADLAALVDSKMAVDEAVPRRIDTLLAGAAILAELGDASRARAIVGQATVLGEPERFVRRFLESDERVREILVKLASSMDSDDLPVGSPVFIDQLAAGLRLMRTVTTRRPAPDGLIDPMSERELEILDLLVEGLSYREMADRLYISRNTVKTHVRHVYTKLGVASREAALYEAERLGIVGSIASRV